MGQNSSRGNNCYLDDQKFAIHTCLPDDVRYVNDGQLNISNAMVENKIRPFCIGRKNWLFSASVEGAVASGLFYSLIETAKENNMEPFDYFNRMLAKLPYAQSLEDYERLLPFKDHFLVD